MLMLDCSTSARSWSLVCCSVWNSESESTISIRLRMMLDCSVSLSFRLNPAWNTTSVWNVV